MAELALRESSFPCGPFLRCDFLLGNALSGLDDILGGQLGVDRCVRLRGDLGMCSLDLSLGQVGELACQSRPLGEYRMEMRSSHRENFLACVQRRLQEEKQAALLFGTCTALEKLDSNEPLIQPGSGAVDVLQLCAVATIFSEGVQVGFGLEVTGLVRLDELTTRPQLSTTSKTVGHDTVENGTVLLRSRIGDIA